MTLSLPNPSSRLLRAAVAEQADLLRHRERLTRERIRLLPSDRSRGRQPGGIAVKQLLFVLPYVWYR